MSFATQFNRSSFAQYAYEIPEGCPYTSLKNLYALDADKVHNVHAFNVNNNSKYGPSPQLATDGYLVNLPAHLLDTVREIMSSEKATDTVNDGKVGFTVYEYTTPQGVVGYSLRWVDL